MIAAYSTFAYSACAQMWEASVAKLRCTSAASPRLPDQGGFCLGYCAVPDFVHDMASIECRVYACYFSDVDSEQAFVAS